MYGEAAELPDVTLMQGSSQVYEYFREAVDLQINAVTTTPRLLRLRALSFGSPFGAWPDSTIFPATPALVTITLWRLTLEVL